MPATCSSTVLTGFGFQSVPSPFTTTPSGLAYTAPSEFGMRPASCRPPPRVGAELGPFREQSWRWGYHRVVVNEGRVFDITTGHQGLPIADYKQLWEYEDFIDFGF